MAREDEFSLEDLILLAAGVLVGLQLLRYMQGGGGASLTFQASAPGGAATLLSAFPMSVSPGGRAFIQSNEGFSLKPYADAGGQAIYWGHRIQPGETFNNTQAQAEQVFDADIAIAESAIRNAVHVALTQDQFDALADYAYNRGSGNFAKSNVVASLNAGNYAQAAQQIKTSVGPANRRTAEQKRFLSTG